VTLGHEIWTADIRYVTRAIPAVGNAYVIAVLENYSRCVLASAVSLTQDTTAFLRVLLGRREVRPSGAPRHRRGRDLQGQAGNGRLPSTRDTQGADRAVKAVPISHRDDFRHPEEDGRLALRQGRNLPRAGGGPRYLERGPQCQRHWDRGRANYFACRGHPISRSARLLLRPSRRDDRCQSRRSTRLDRRPEAAYSAPRCIVCRCIEGQSDAGGWCHGR
jgi:hypothetical protein